MKQIFKATDKTFEKDYIAIYQTLHNEIEVNTIEDFGNEEEPVEVIINLNKEQAIEMANAILEHYNS